MSGKDPINEFIEMEDVKLREGEAAAEDSEDESVVDMHAMPKQNYELPYLQDIDNIPEALVASFEVVRHKGEKHAFGDDNFNDLGREIPRDNVNRVGSNDELIARVNDYEYMGSLPGKIGFMVCCPLFYFPRRKVVRAGYFGHYTSSGRHMLKAAGIHTLSSLTDKWVEPREIPIDDETTLIRPLGSKTILVVPENHIAGGFRIGKVTADGEDGEFVLFGQGRHVLDNERYRMINIKKLEHDIVKIGPLTVLYVKEGFLGGAFERNRGTYKIFHPGPPYVLHEKDFEQIDLSRRTLDPFKLGPVYFVTVKDGQLAGAYVKKTGYYQILPPGHTYWLHSKDYEKIDLVARTDQFELGPFTFLTVHKGFVAGAFRKKGGEFVILPPGSTYQLNEEDYESPIVVKRDKHIVTCGPLTFLTVHGGILTGAYRTVDGQFEEFKERDGEYVLHQRDYHHLVTIEKYKYTPQQFGPNKTITIPEGFCGVFEKEGAIEIKDPGFYKVSSQYQLRDSIPLKTMTETFSNLEFKTKDSISMAVNFSLVWKVVDGAKVARYPGSFEEMTTRIQDKAKVNAKKLCKTFNRDQLLPTQQDVLVSKGEMKEEEIAEVMQRVSDKTKEIYSRIESMVLEIMEEASNDSSWGVSMVSVRLDGFDLRDQRIQQDLANITQSLLATKAKQVEGRLAVAQADAERGAAMEKARARAEVAETQAGSDARVKLAVARAGAEIKVMEATNQAKADAEGKKIALQIKQQTAEAEANIQRTKLRIKTEEADAEASAIKAIAEANFEKAKKENEASGMLPSQEVELRKAQLAVEGLKHYGEAAWKYPDEMTAFLQQLLPFLRLGPASAAEVMSKVSSMAKK